MSAKAQMQWTLTENESKTTLEAWIDKLICILSQEEIFTPFLRPDATWGKRQERVHLDASLGLTQQIGVLYLNSCCYE